jgi:hypothetical protein
MGNKWTFLNNVRKGKLVNVNEIFSIYTHQNGQVTKEQINEHIKKLHYPPRSRHKQMAKNITDMTAYMHRNLSPDPT